LFQRFDLRHYVSNGLTGSVPLGQLLLGCSAPVLAHPLLVFLRVMTIADKYPILGCTVIDPPLIEGAPSSLGRVPGQAEMYRWSAWFNFSANRYRRAHA
jgi:hypothetical protein